MENKLIVITGVTGFIGSSVFSVFLEYQKQNPGFSIRVTVRDKSNEQRLKPLRERFGQDITERVEFVNADLLKPETLDEAIKGAYWVVHTASPVVIDRNPEEDELVKPAVSGNTAVMNACVKYGVERVVITSSVSAIAYGLDEFPEVYNESHFTDPTIGNLSPYIKSKTQSELTAWRIQREAKEKGLHVPELVILLPVLVMGEVIGLGSADSTSTNFVKKLLNNGFDKLPVMSLSIVDVEEVALAHLRALTVPKAANQRYIISNRHCSWVEMATILNEELAKEYDGVNVTTKQWSYCQAWTQSFYSQAALYVYARFGRIDRYDNKKSREELGIEYQDVRKSFYKTAKHYLDQGIFKHISKK